VSEVVHGAKEHKQDAGVPAAARAAHPARTGSQSERTLSLFRMARASLASAVREEFFENIEVSLALDLLGIPADNSFRGIGSRGGAHAVNSLKSLR
jgi:hypothetical protein